MRKIISSLILVTFLTSLITAPAGAQFLPVPGTPVTLSAGFQPPVLLGLKIHPENPFLFDFIVDQGVSKLSDDELKLETEKLVKYFLAALTIPDKEVWVNLSPYEKDRIIPDVLGQTTMGKTMLEQDYMLKQLASSLTNPDEKLGREFWTNVKNQVQAQLKTADVPMSTFNKVWIVPGKAEVLESNGIVLVGEKRLKVMMDEERSNQKDRSESLATARADDYEALIKSGVITGGEKNAVIARTPLADAAISDKEFASQKALAMTSSVFRATILPNIEKEINEGKNFADVRQIYNSVILATWYKKALKESLLGKVYADKGKVVGVETDDKDMKQKIYEQYLAAFKKGVYNLIKEESDPAGDMIPRKYFSGGIEITNFVANSSLVTRPVTLAQAEQIIGTVAGSSAVRVQMVEPESAERDIVAASAVVASSGVSGVDNNVIIPQGPYAIWQLTSKLYNAGYSAKAFSDFLNRIAGGSFEGHFSEASLDRLAVDRSPIKTMIDGWVAAVKRGNQFYFSGDRFALILDLVRQNLQELNQHNFFDFYLENRAVLYVPILFEGARPVQILFGNHKVYVEKTPDNRLKITDPRNQGSYVAALDEEVLIGRDRTYPNGALKFSDNTVSGTHFGVTLKYKTGYYFFEIKDGYAPKASSNKTVVVTDGVLTKFIRMLKPENLLSKSVAFLSSSKEGTTFQQARISGHPSGLLQVYVGDGIYNIWREGDKVFFQADESAPTKPEDTRIFQGNVGTTYRVGSAESPGAVSVQGNDWFIQGNRSMFPISSGGHFSFSFGQDGAFTVNNLTPQLTGTLVKWVAAASSGLDIRIPSAQDGEWLNKEQFKKRIIAGEIPVGTKIAFLEYDDPNYVDDFGEKNPNRRTIASNKAIEAFHFEEGDPSQLRAISFTGSPGVKLENIISVQLAASSGMNRRNFLGGLAAAVVGGVVSPDTKAQEEKGKVVSVVDHPTDEDKRITSGQSFRTWYEGSFDLKDAQSVLLTFPPEQAGVNFVVRLLPRLGNKDLATGLNTKVYTVPPGGGAVEIPINEFPISGGALSDILHVSIHSGRFAWNVPLRQTNSPGQADVDKKAIPLKVEKIVKVSSGAVGGIDFDPTNMNLQIKRDGKGVPLPLPQQNLEQINIQGLIPIIINIVPMNTETLPIFLGQAEKEPGREPELAVNTAS